MPSTLLTAQLLFLEAESPTLPIKLYINSPGGSVTAGLAIYDTMQYIQSPVHTFCMGQAASMGSLLLAGGEKGHRYVLKNGSVMIHRKSLVSILLSKVRVRASMDLLLSSPSSSPSAWSDLKTLSKNQADQSRTLRRRIRPSLRYSSPRQRNPSNPRIPNRHLRLALPTTRRRTVKRAREVWNCAREGLFHDCERGCGIWDSG